MAFPPGGIFNDLFVGRDEQLAEAGIAGGSFHVGGHVSRSRIWADPVEGWGSKNGRSGLGRVRDSMEEDGSDGGGVLEFGSRKEDWSLGTARTES